MAPQVPPSQMLYVLNGNFVGLATVPEEEVTGHLLLPLPLLPYIMYPTTLIWILY